MAFAPGYHPPLPRALKPEPPVRLKGGCYFIRATVPAVFSSCEGTLRVQREGDYLTASGDLYRSPSPLVTPDLAAGIPIFPRRDYRHYLRVTKISTSEKGFALKFDRYSFDHKTDTWVSRESFTAAMRWTAAPPGYPNGGDYWRGDLADKTGELIGAFTMGRVSGHFRRAVIEIDRVSQSPAPLDNGFGMDWRAVFDQVGWLVDAKESNSDIAERSSNGVWEDSELHQEMLKWRDAAELDREWRYHLLCVRQLDGGDGRGVMYDKWSTDSTNNIPREGAAIASHWNVPHEEQWGIFQGMRLGAAKPLYFRVAVHEISHAMNLDHRRDTSFMATTDSIVESARKARPPVKFPDNIQWAYSLDDQEQLRHAADIWVRPGGTQFYMTSTADTGSPGRGGLRKNTKGLELRVFPLMEEVPIGAPVRIKYRLSNTAHRTREVPASLSLKKGHVKGVVIDPAGDIRAFRPLVLCGDKHSLRLLEPGESLAHTVTLLRGAQGALFPSPGAYRIMVEISWHSSRSKASIAGETRVKITPPVDQAHAEAALKILSCPDALLALVIGGDHLQEGVEAISAGIHNPVLRPHYAIIEAKRLGRRFGKRRADFNAACQFLDKTAVLSDPEIEHAVELIQNAGRAMGGHLAEKVAKVLEDKMRNSDVDEEFVKICKQAVEGI